jgi:ribosomal protein S1
MTHTVDTSAYDTLRSILRGMQQQFQTTMAQLRTEQREIVADYRRVLEDRRKQQLMEFIQKT